MIGGFNLFCPTLCDKGGHELGYTDGLAAALSARGIRTRIILPECAPDLIRHKTSRVKLPPRTEGGPTGLVSHLKSRLNELGRQAGFKAAFNLARPEEVILIHTAGFADMALAGKTAAATQRRTSLLLRYDHYDDAAAISVIRDLSVNPWVILLTDSQKLSDAFSEIIGRQIAVVPPPIHLVDLPPTPADGRLSLAYLGGARPSKGFDRLPTILREIRAIDQYTDILVQAYQHSDDARAPSVENALADLSELPGVELVTSVTSQKTYLDWLARIDAAILPYDTFTYRAVSSGVFVEVIAAGRHVLVPDNTWMASEAQRCGLSRASIVDFASREFIAAALNAVRSGNGRPCEATARWARAHTYDALAAGILQALAPWR